MCTTLACMSCDSLDATLPTTGYSAFGSTEPVYDPGGERIRWFCPWQIAEMGALERALDTVADLAGTVCASRITFRVVSSGELSPDIIEVLTDRGFQIEARMAFSDANGRVITYLAQCHPERKSAQGDVRSEQALLGAIMARPRKGPATILREFRMLDEFRVEMIGPDSLSPSDTDRLIALHRETFPTFPYDFASKLALMLGAPNCYLMCLVRSLKNGKIYAFSNLEINTVTLEDGPQLRLAEYDNSMRVATCPDHGEVKGLGAILRLQLASLASRLDVDLCHAESRAALAAINGNSYHLGMHFGGTLEKHLLISGQHDISYQAPSRFESMNVWYLNRAQLATLEMR